MPEVSLYLDDRKEKGSPALLKIRIYLSRTEVKHYNAKLPKMARADYEAALSRVDPPKSKVLRDLRKKIEDKEALAKKIIEDLGRDFEFEKFEKEFYRTGEDRGDAISSRYNEYIEQLESEDKASSADVYRISLKSLTTYWQTLRDSKRELSFSDITPAFLKKYERWYINSGKEKQKSHTSIGIYLRCLRAIFNKAILSGDIKKEHYPFGRGKYEIPAGSNVKKALGKDELKILLSAKVELNSAGDVARDFWFFSYFCNGMNLRDIANLKFSNLHLEHKNPYFTFTREKTKNTLRKTDRPPIRVPITEPVRKIIDKHANNDQRPGNYVFPIFSRGMTAKEQLRIIRNFIKFINTHITKLAAANGINSAIGTMTARHTFTTQIVKKKGLVFAQEALGPYQSHNNTKLLGRI